MIRLKKPSLNKAYTLYCYIFNIIIMSSAFACVTCVIVLLLPFLLSSFSPYGPAHGFFLFKRSFSCQCWLFGARAWFSVKHQILYDKSYIYLKWLFIPLLINNGERKIASFKKVHYHILKEPWNVLLIHQRTKTNIYCHCASGLICVRKWVSWLSLSLEV